MPYVNMTPEIAQRVRDQTRERVKRHRQRLAGLPWAPPAQVVPDPVDRWWSFIRRSESGCWDWTGPKERGGYARFSLGGKSIPANRFGYELVFDKVPRGLDLDHLCGNRACVRPDHHEPVTRAENIRRSWIDTPVRVFRKRDGSLGQRRRRHNVTFPAI